jgi:membrane-associated phospholipid phosphatase
MTAIHKWLASLAGTAAAVAIAYQWLDRAIALLAHHDVAQHEVFGELTHIPDPLLPVAIVIFVAAGLTVLSGRRLPKLNATTLLCAMSAMIAEVTKSILKFVFGRTWPETWLRDNPSFIHDRVYGFNFFHGGDAYASFPSGHLTVTAAVVSVLWIAYPRWRALYALCVVAVAVGLIGANYHFLSDIIAGAFVGVSTGWMTTALWRVRADLRPAPAR